MFLAGLELLSGVLTSWPFVRTQGTCITLLVSLRNVISEQRRLKNKGKDSRFKMEKNFVKMEKIFVKMEKLEEILVIFEKIVVTIRCDLSNI